MTGAARFTVDVKLPGMLHARLLRSPHAHARLLGLDFAAARAQPGVRAALALNETVGRAVEAPPADGAEARRVLYVGDIVAGVAADSPAAAEAALGLIKADYQPLPFVVDLEGARQPDAPRVFERPVHGENYAGGDRERLAAAAGRQRARPEQRRLARRRGRGLARAEVVVEGEFRTQVQTHCCMETHAVVADWRADGLTVYMSTQFTAGVRARAGARVRLAARPGAGGGRRDGRRLRLEVGRRQLRARRGRAVARGARAGAPRARPARGAASTAATGRPPCRR